MAQKTALDDKFHWYKDAIIYELHIKAFCDGNGDGIGDFEGLMSKLDYLEELGVTAIWVLPFYPSPLKDDGYDIADYYTINPNYGDIKSFKAFLKEAHKRNLKVITELVLNHTSDQHPWFMRARKSPRGSWERDFYVWSDDPEKYKDVRIIFTDFESSNWTWDSEAQQYYWHRFFHHQPDLNYDSPKVQQEIFRIIDYWCKMGVDGFRLDAVPYLFERENTNGENLPETHEFLKKLRAHIDKHFPGTLFLAEANMWPEDSASYFGDGDECHMNYHFPLMPRMFMSIQMEDKHPITDIFDQTPEIPPNCQWAMFLRNHDELTLEMVTDEERDYMYRVYAKDPKARINLGIRHRLAPLMDNDRRKIELMNSLLFSMPGTPVIYYGDEIGMGDNFYLGDRDGVRTPMQWSPDRNAGFSSANPQRLYLPTILDPAYNYEAVNVENQRANTSSLFWFMKHMITMRKNYKAFGRGDLKFLNVANPKVLAFTRTHEDETILVLVNLSKFSQPAEVDLSEFAGSIPVEVFSQNQFPAVKQNAPYFFTFGPHSFQWFLLQSEPTKREKKEVLPELEMNKWEDLVENSNANELVSKILPGYLNRTNWHSGKDRVIFKCQIADKVSIEMDDEPVHWFLIEVQYKAGLPDLYQLPLAHIRNVNSELLQNYPKSVICKLKVGDKEGLLVDAFYTRAFQHWLFRNMAGSHKTRKHESILRFEGDSEIRNYYKHNKEVRSQVHVSEDQSNTAITYNNCYFLKMYRKIDQGQHPDLEISQYLHKEAGFEYTPYYHGSIEWRFKKGNYSIGMMQEMVENHGDGHMFMLERINNYIERILAAKYETPPQKPKGLQLSESPLFEELSEEIQLLIGNRAAEQSRLIGVRVGELHQALAGARMLKDFNPENFSLHYQRSLYSAMTSLVREAYSNVQQHKKELDTPCQALAKKMLGAKNELIQRLKRIYAHKIDIIKIRIHGNLSLRQILLTGKDLVIHDFGGDPTKNYGERRLKRSPLRDVASMMRSFYYTAYEGILSTNQVPRNDINSLVPYAELWAYYMSGFFLRSWLETVGNADFVPDSTEELNMLLENYMIEKALFGVNERVRMGNNGVMAPLCIFNNIIRH